jgi:GTP-binding protein
MRFVDEAEIILTSGRGGKGCSSFRREKYIAHGGPNGGDGGDGGSIILKADDSMGSLLDFRHQKEIRAKKGEGGMGSNMHGKNGDSVTVLLPVGTLVRDAETGEILADLVNVGESIVLLKGGLGGRGNARFATANNRTPTYCQPGEEAQTLRVRFELKLMADVGLLGFPNAGKSTLISRISAAKPKVADYPFTTLVPNLGVVSYGDRTFVVADIPGLIEGASDGAGLGIQFLKHVERTRLLLHLVDPVDGRDPVEKYQVLRNELAKFDPDLAKRTERVVVTKMDVTEAREEFEDVCARFKEMGIEPWGISAATGDGIDELVRRTGRLVMTLRKEEGNDDSDK